MKKSLLIFLLAICGTVLAAQPGNFVKWTFSVKDTGTDNVYDIIFDADIESPWHMYDLGPYEGGPNATAFEFKENGRYRLLGNARHNVAPKKIDDPIFMMELGYFALKASFVQTLEVLSPGDFTLEASVEYQLCDDQSCLMPTEYEFYIPVKGTGIVTVAESNDLTENPEEPVSENLSDSLYLSENTVVAQVEPKVLAATEFVAFEPDHSMKTSLWALIISAILWGFAALLTPCVFPMVPMTVSYFLKYGEKKNKGKFGALLYGISIVALYTIPIGAIILITYFAGGRTVTADIFNWLATHWLPNVLFFIVFILFAASFFGAFELRMPSRLVNKSDSKADKGGFAGIFFMALTLVLVSFSCTGPIVGTILISATQGEIWEPVLAMLLFSTAFALPFTLLAVFPAFMKKLPKSGGWLNSVKIVLGFIEIALAFKFLSVADQTYHWGLLDREIYLAIWITVFSLLGFYLLGKLRFAHDSEVKCLNVTRLTLSIITFSFVVYMIPGLWGAPLKGLSGYLPPISTQDFCLGNSIPVSEPRNGMAIKYGDFLSLPDGINGFFDYEEALSYARSVKKPLFIDFTGHGCVNCREMEAKVFSDPRVISILNEKFVVVAVYTDDRKELPENEWVRTENGKVLKTLGKVNSRLANDKYGVGALPYYVIIDGNENIIASPRGYNLNITAFLEFLETGANNYGK
ncbi:MAG: thioredoxin family protein [Rikenellaceae bacterium]|nr:thioredoxin family protein [Rikenellaceae bacterium]